jgi:hypothetical protein
MNILIPDKSSKTNTLFGFTLIPIKAELAPFSQANCALFLATRIASTVGALELFVVENYLPN